ncbi:MAG: lysine transporter LysE [Cytophagaceae bacterium]|nr:lysine transporter LysE [Cytophagaceae bacterium]
MFETLLAFVGATAILALSPGPDNIYVLAQSIANGSKAGLATTAGLILGCIVHTTLIAFGVSALLTTTPTILWGIKFFGAAYLLYLAYKVWQSDSEVALTQGAPKKSYKALFKQGVIMNVLNPKVTLFFLSFFPAFIWDQQANTVGQFYILGFVFMGTSLVIFSGFALLAGSISNGLQQYQNAGLVLKWVQIIVFVGIAIFILFP